MSNEIQEPQPQEKPVVIDPVKPELEKSDLEKPSSSSVTPSEPSEAKADSSEPKEAKADSCEYEKKKSELEAEFASFKRIYKVNVFGAIYIFFFVLAWIGYIYYVNLPTLAPAPQPLPPVTLKQLVNEKIQSLSPYIFQENEINNLEMYLTNVNYYRKNFGEYPPRFVPDNFLTEFTPFYGINPSHLKKVLDLFEANIHPIEQNPKIIDFFTSPFFLFDHNMKNYPTDRQKKIYYQRVECIEEITNRISGKGFENDILNELLVHEPQDFIFKLIKKYSNGKITHPKIAKYVRKAKWFEEMFSNGMLSEKLVVNYLDISLEHHTKYYVGQVIKKLLEFDHSNECKKAMSLELIRYYAGDKISINDAELDYFFGYLNKINYHFTVEDIKLISLEMNNLGQQVEHLWNAIRNEQADFNHYYKINSV